MSCGAQQRAVGELAVGVAVHRRVEGRVDEQLRAHGVALVARGDRREIGAGAVAADDDPGGSVPSCRAPAPAAQATASARPGRPPDTDARAPGGSRRSGTPHPRRWQLAGHAIEDSMSPTYQPPPCSHTSDAERLGRHGRPVGARPHPTALDVGDHDVLDPCDLLHRPAELERGLQVGGALGFEVGRSGLVAVGERASISARTCGCRPALTRWRARPCRPRWRPRCAARSPGR